jgi:hypothetical protein
MRSVTAAFIVCLLGLSSCSSIKSDMAPLVSATFVSGEAVTLDPVNLIRTDNRQTGELSLMPDFVAKIEEIAPGVDISSTGVSALSVSANGPRRWMTVRFRFGGTDYAFSGGLLSSDLLVKATQAIQFQPRVLVGGGTSGDELIDMAIARAPWVALKAALALVAKQAAQNVGLSV